MLWLSKGQNTTSAERVHPYKLFFETAYKAIFFTHLTQIHPLQTAY